MSFVSEYNLGRDASTTSFLTALVCFLSDTVLRCLLTLRDRPERKRAVRLVGMDTGCAVAWLPIILFYVRRLWQNLWRSGSILVMEFVLCYSSHMLTLSILPQICRTQGDVTGSDDVSRSRRT